MGSANTPESVMSLYRSLWLKKCSLNLVEIPKNVNSMLFCDIYENCVKFWNMIPIAIYKRHQDERSFNGQQENKAEAFGNHGEEKTQRKQYVWLHPPKNIELSIYDELFVLCEKSERE